jgi:hypothetical protein
MHSKTTLFRLAPIYGFDGDDTPSLEDLLKRDDVASALQTRIDAAVEQATSGLKKNKDEILNEKRELAAALQTLQGQVGELGDLESVKKILSRIESDEDARLISEGKIDEVVAKRVERAVLDANKRADALEAKLAEATQTIGTQGGTINKLVVETALQNEAVKLGVQPSAVDDFVRRGLSVFSASEDLQPVALDSEKSPILGADAKTPLTITEWGEDLKTTAGHLWPPSSGGGAGGSGNTNRDDTPDLDNLSPTAKLAAGLANQDKR